MGMIMLIHETPASTLILPPNLRGSGAWMPAKPVMIQEMQAAVQHRHRATVYMSHWLCGCSIQHHRIDLGQKVVDESLPVSRQCHGVCHTLISAHTAAVGPHGNSRDSPSQLNYRVPNKIPLETEHKHEQNQLDNWKNTEAVAARG